MKIIITAKGEALNSEVDPRFGRAVKFILYDEETGDSRVVDNAQNLNAAQGAGIQAAQTVAGLGAEVVITGHCGPKAFRVFKTAGIRIFSGATGTVSEAIALFKEGQLKELMSPDAEGH